MVHIYWAAWVPAASSGSLENDDDDKRTESKYPWPVCPRTLGQGRLVPAGPLTRRRAHSRALQVVPEKAREAKCHAPPGGNRPGVAKASQGFRHPLPCGAGGLEEALRQAVPTSWRSPRGCRSSKDCGELAGLGSLPLAPKLSHPAPAPSTLLAPISGTFQVLPAGLPSSPSLIPAAFCNL